MTAWPVLGTATNLQSFNTDPSNFEVSQVRQLLQSHHEADIRDAPTLARAMREATPEVVFHLAAQPIVRVSYKEPRQTFEFNAIGTASLLDAVRALKKPCVVVSITSDKCYENVEQVWGYREVDTLGGYDPYSASKGCAELIISAYRRSFFNPEKLSEHGVKLASTRAGNVIGGGDWSRDRIVVDVARAIAAGQPVQVRSPHSVRPWEHVLEPLSGYLSLAARLLSSDDPHWCSPWNFGPLLGEEVPVGKLVEEFIAAWGAGSWQDVSSQQQPHEAQILRLCIDKSVWNLGWTPRWSVRQAVEHTARWYKRFYKGDKKMRDACAADIEAYVNARTV